MTSSSGKMDMRLVLPVCVVLLTVWLVVPADGTAFSCPTDAYDVPTQNTPPCPKNRGKRDLTSDIAAMKTEVEGLKEKVQKAKSDNKDDQMEMENSLNAEKKKREDLANQLPDMMKKVDDLKTAAEADIDNLKTGQSEALKQLKAKLQDLKQKVNDLEAKVRDGVRIGEENKAGKDNTDGTSKPPKQNKPKDVQDCAHIHEQSSSKRSGLYSSMVPGVRTSVITYCDMDSTKEGGGWTVIQRRQTGDSFERKWNEYKHGFGDPMGTFWWGNEKVHQLTQQKPYQLRVELQNAAGIKRVALYDDFKLEGEDSKYTLHVGKYSGTAGDALRTHNGNKFSTKDQDNDDYAPSSCAEGYKGGWWYNDHCFDGNLNAAYENEATEGTLGYWLSFNGYKGLTYTAMMIRPSDYKPKTNSTP
ncbi:ANGPTL7 [Branchiostoma lanceolatum]|uniref:ANGPTL7 protein n=1 Tax=Branchiostoma lanceolatum TaxID=7740 RepID=A0A8J9ZD80_BRALA|nr:ANGPTL7 [Branchiostoma lanceolatum]